MPAAFVPWPKSSLHPEPLFHGILGHLLLVGLTALLLGLSFPRVGWPWLAHLALAPAAILALRSTSCKRLAWTAFLVSLIWWLVMIQWLANVTFGGYVALSAVMALYLPATLLIHRGLVRRWRLWSVLALPMAWITMELIRGHTPAGGFGWFALGHSQAPSEPGQSSRLIQIADLFSETGVSFLVAMSGGAIVDCLSLMKENRAARVTHRARRLGFPLSLWAVAMTAALTYGQYRLHTTPQHMGPAITVAVVQTNVPQDNKINPTEESVLEDWLAMVKLMVAAGRGQPRPDLIATPETMAPAALNPEALEYYRDAPTAERGYEQFHGQLSELAQRLDTNLLVGAHAKYDWQPVQDRGSGRTYLIPSRRYNAAFHYAPPGSRPRLDDAPQAGHDLLAQASASTAYYAKIHRVPFGEYIPWVDAWPWIKDLFMRYFSPYQFDYSLTPGEAFTVFNMPFNGHQAAVAAPICFEDAVPRVVRQMVYAPGGGKRADLLVNLTNDGWYPGSMQGVQHFQIAVLRCVENRVPMARSVNTGVSGFIDSAGRILSMVNEDGQIQQVSGYAVAALPLDGRPTVYGRRGQVPVWLLAVLTLFLTLVGSLRGGKIRDG